MIDQQSKLNIELSQKLQKLEFKLIEVEKIKEDEKLFEVEKQEENLPMEIQSYYRTDEKEHLNENNFPDQFYSCLPASTNRHLQELSEF